MNQTIKSSDIILYMHGGDPDIPPAGQLLTNGYLKDGEITKLAFSGAGEGSEDLSSLLDLKSLLLQDIYTRQSNLTLIRIYCGRGNFDPFRVIVPNLRRAINEAQGDYRIYLMGQSQGGHNVADLARLLQQKQFLAGVEIIPEYVGLLDPAFDSSCATDPHCKDMEIPGKQVDLYYQDISEMIRSIFPNDEYHGPMPQRQGVYQINLASEYASEGFSSRFIDHRKRMVSFLKEYNDISKFSLTFDDDRTHSSRNHFALVNQASVSDPPHVEACNIGLGLGMRRIVKLIQARL